MSLWISRYACVVVVTTLPSYAIAQEACVALLQHGIYDHLRQSNVTSRASEMQTSICQAYNQYRQDRTSGSVQASYVIASVGGSFSKDQIDAVGQFMCASNQSASTATSNLTIMQDKIDPEATRAFSECTALYADDLRTKTTFREEDQAALTLEVRYVLAPGLNGQSINIDKITITPSGSFACEGELVDRKGSPIYNDAVAMTCTRVVQTEAVEYMGKRVYAPPAAIVVETGAGNVVRHVSSIPAGPPPTPLVVPISTVIAFSGTLKDAENMKQYGWYLCNGQRVDDPLAGDYNGKNVPDLSDRFLIGSAKTSGISGGVSSITVPSQGIQVEALGFKSPADGPSIPPLGPASGAGWETFHHLLSNGNTSAFTFDNRPPYFSILYLIKVK